MNSKRPQKNPKVSLRFSEKNCLHVFLSQCVQTILKIEAFKGKKYRQFGLIVLSDGMTNQQTQFEI